MCLPQPLPGPCPPRTQGGPESTGASPAKPEPLLLVPRHKASLGTFLPHLANAGQPLTGAPKNLCETRCHSALLLTLSGAG